MATSKCQYLNCENTRDTHSLFGFPRNDKRRLRIWIKHSGNPKLRRISPKSLYNRCLCGDHFDQRYKKITYQRRKRIRLFKTAIPRHYKKDDNTENEEEVKEEWKNDDNESDAGECSVSNTRDANMFAVLCKECHKPITRFKFRWWCLQCGGPCCRMCVLRLVHRPHMVLRTCSTTTPKQSEMVIAAIERELKNQGLFKTCDGEKQDETADAQVDTAEKTVEEPVIKTDPPDEADDPFANCTYNDYITTQPTLQPDQMAVIYCNLRLFTDDLSGQESYDFDDRHSLQP